jgi:RepB DNA-primase from phage plasmid
VSAQIDEAAVRQFIEIISAHALRAINSINGSGQTGFLQLCRISPHDDETIVPSRFQIGDIEHMVKTAIDDAAAGHNVYIEARTVRAGLLGKQRGTFEDTVWVLGLVIDSDADKNKSGNVTARPTLATETSPGNFQLWYLFTRAITVAQARPIGDAIRTSSGADQDTGVITQCYRVAGTPNFPSVKKRARGRVTVEPTKIFEHSGRLWDPNELLEAFSTPSSSSARQSAGTGPSANADEMTLPDDLLEIIRHGAAPGADRSGVFHKIIADLERRHWTVDAITELFERYPNGIAEKYRGRVRKEVERSYNKISSAASTTATAAPGTTAGTTSGAASAGPQPQPQAGQVRPTIRIVASELPRVIDEAEAALIAAGGFSLYQRGSLVVRPVRSRLKDSRGRPTYSWRLIPVREPYMIETLTRAAEFEKWDARARRFTPKDCPAQIAETYLAREGHWRLPVLLGVVNAPFIRTDGSVCEQSGYDSASELLFEPDGQTFPAITANPTKDDAVAALAYLETLIRAFPFVTDIDRAVALSGILTAFDRRSMATAPLHGFTAPDAGTGKSLLVDIASLLATGQKAPVISQGRHEEELEKRLGAALIAADTIINIDNCDHQLEGVFLCQALTQQRLKIRLLGHSRQVEVPVSAAMYTTGNNLIIASDLVRRSLLCTIDAGCERPEARRFDFDVVETIQNNRGQLVAAALAVLRAWHAAAVPSQAEPLGGFEDWSRRIREPLLWLGREDPCSSEAKVRRNDPERAAHETVLIQWQQTLGIETRRTIQQVKNAALADMDFQAALVSVAGDRGGVFISNERLGRWLRKVEGKIVNGLKLVQDGNDHGYQVWKLTRG